MLFGYPLGLSYSAQLHSQELPAEERRAVNQARTLALPAAQQKKLQATVDKGQQREHTEGKNQPLFVSSQREPGAPHREKT